MRILLVSALVIAAIAVYGVVRHFIEERRWKAFAAEHGCTIVRPAAPELSVYHQQVDAALGQDLWRCSDGSEFLR